jgi:hypothetical protein
MDEKKEALHDVWTLDVQIPSERPRRFGVNASGHHSAHRQMLRHPKEEFDLIHEVSNILGIAPAVFTSEAARNMALAILKKIKEKTNADRSDSGGGTGPL